MADKRPRYTFEQMLDQGPDDASYPPPAPHDAEEAGTAMLRDLKEWTRRRAEAMTPEQLRERVFEMFNMSPAERLEVIEWDEWAASLKPAPAGDKPPRPRKQGGGLKRRMLTKRPQVPDSEADEQEPRLPRRDRHPLVADDALLDRLRARRR